MRVPLGIVLSGCNRIIFFSSTTPPRTKHSEWKFAICFFGKFVTAMICFPLSCSGVYKWVICALDCFMPSGPKSMVS